MPLTDIGNANSGVEREGWWRLLVRYGDGFAGEVMDEVAVVRDVEDGAVVLVEGVF